MTVKFRESIINPIRYCQNSYAILENKLLAQFAARSTMQSYDKYVRK